MSQRDDFRGLSGDKDCYTVKANLLAPGSYHKNIALVEPFRQSQQIDLSRDMKSYQFSRIFSIFKNNVFVTE